MTFIEIDPQVCDWLSSKLQPARRRLALLDVDGTLTREKSSWQFLMEQVGCWEPTGRENLERYLCADITYDEFCGLDGALFSGMEYYRLREIAHSVPMYGGLGFFFTTLASMQFDIAIISTGLRLLTSYFTSQYHIGISVSNDLASCDGVCTGSAIVEIREDEKGVVARRVVRDFQPDFIFAMGDSSGDLPLFDLADLALAVNPVDEKVRYGTTAQLYGNDLSVIGNLMWSMDQCSD